MKITPTLAISATIILAGLLLGYVCRLIFPIYTIIFFSFFLSGLLLAQSIKRVGWIVYNFAFVFLALAIAELYFEFEKTDATAAYPHIMESHDGLGYVARPGTFRAVKTYGFGSGVVYDVHYSIDKNGLRIVPNSLKKTGPTVMFFIDSFTFGEGVNDDETLPNAFSIISGMRVLNFGLAGYGPHHMLRLLELDVPKKIEPSLELVPHLMVYTALIDHSRRAAGRRGFESGPHYEVENGRAQYVGAFRNVPVFFEKLLNHSRIWNAYASHHEYYPDDLNARDRTRFLEIVKAANVIARQKYHTRLVVILWDFADGSSVPQTFNWIEANLNKNGIPTLKLSSAIKEAGFMDWIIKGDGHPNPRAYREVARILLSWLKQNPTMVSLPSQ